MHEIIFTAHAFAYHLFFSSIFSSKGISQFLSEIIVGINDARYILIASQMSLGIHALVWLGVEWAMKQWKTQNLTAIYKVYRWSEKHL